MSMQAILNNNWIHLAEEYSYCYRQCNLGMHWRFADFSPLNGPDLIGGCHHCLGGGLSSISPPPVEPPLLGVFLQFGIVA